MKSVLCVENLCKTYPGFSLDRVSFSLAAGRIMGLIGKNGAGKTTLLKIIAGELLEHTDIQAAYMPQNYDELLCGSLTPVAFLCKTALSYKTIDYLLQINN